MSDLDPLEFKSVTILVIGPKGSGKTTLAKILKRLFKGIKIVEIQTQ